MKKKEKRSTMIVQFLETKMYIEVLRTILVKLAEMVDYAPLKIFTSRNGQVVGSLQGLQI